MDSLTESDKGIAEKTDLKLQAINNKKNIKMADMNERCIEL